MPRRKKARAQTLDRVVPDAPDSREFKLTGTQRRGLEQLHSMERSAQFSPIRFGGSDCLCHCNFDRK